MVSNRKQRCGPNLRDVLEDSPTRNRPSLNSPKSSAADDCRLLTAASVHARPPHWPGAMTCPSVHGRRHYT